MSPSQHAAHPSSCSTAPLLLLLLPLICDLRLNWQCTSPDRHLTAHNLLHPLLRS
jgi:hypothetical protein